MAEQKKINVLYVASEAAPMIKVGGLGDVAGSLPIALRKLAPEKINGKQLDVRLVLPFHSLINQKLDNLQLISSFMVPYPHGQIPARVFQTIVDDLPIYLVEGSTILSDTSVYSPDPRKDAKKYIFFSLAILELVKDINWPVDILHANDWHTAISVYDLRIRRPQDQFFRETKSIFSMHNMPYMGAGSETILSEFGIPPCDCPRLPDWAHHVPLPMGMYAADQILTVSPNYAKEIMTPEYGCGLQDFLISRKDTVSGILNGLDESKWDPSNDQAIHFNYSVDQISQRINNKLALQTEFGLEKNPEIPLFVLITRMDQQKGIDLAIEAFRSIQQEKWQAILLGTGDPVLESASRSLEVEMPDRVRAVIRFDLNLSKRMYAGGDLLVIPSRYEPCGLTQMIAMRYGCIPLARSTGGLKDTILDQSKGENNNGFLFNEANVESLANCMKRAISNFAQRKHWQTIQLNGMNSDFSWEKSALEYANIYTKLSKI